MKSHFHKTSISPAHLHIDGKQAYHHFFKTNPKYIAALQVENLVIPHLHATEMKQMKAQFIKIGKRTKKIYRLCVQKQKASLYFRLPKLVEIIKYFRKVQTLGLPSCVRSKEMFKANIQWLHFCKDLKRYYCISQDAYYLTTVKEEMKSFHIQFFHTLKKSELKFFHTSLFDNVSKISFDCLPITLEQLFFHLRESTICAKCETTPQNYQGALSRLTVLHTLELLIPTEPLILAQILSTAYQPAKFITLGLDVDTIEDCDTTELENVLESFSGLMKLTLKINSLVLAIRILKALQNCPLHFFELHVTVEQEDDLYQLGYLLGGWRNLEIVKIKLFGQVRENVPEAYISLFEQLGHLSELKIVDINVSIGYNETSPSSFKGILSAFSNSLDQFSGLRELGFEYSNGDFFTEFLDFAKVLQKKARNLRRLEIGFPANKELKKEHLLAFVEALREMVHLEVLSFANLTSENKRLVGKLINSFYQFMCLRTLKLSNVSIQVSRKSFLDVIKKLLARRGFEAFHCRGAIQLIGQEKNNLSIDSAELLNSNPKLTVIYLPPSISKYFTNTLLINGNKWK